jgi:transmembrane sensor
MLDDENNMKLNSDNTILSDDQLQFECEQAMLRRHYAQPSIDAEWSKFCKDTNSKSSSALDRQPANRTSKLRYFIFGSISGVAAMLLILLAFHWYAKWMNNRPVKLFVAKTEAQQIMISSGEDEDNATAITAVQKYKDPIQSVAVSAQKADFTKVSPSEAEMRTISTPYGKDYRVTLNDGTEVVMNAGSKLTFPTCFTGKTRIVRLVGEAYFKVAKNPKMPFIVQTEKMNTRALGTEFNVRAYSGAEPHVTLIEGSVIVNVADKNVQLKPGEDISFSNSTVKIKNVDTQYYIQWKDGFLYFDNQPLVDVMSDLGRWYNVNIEIENPSLMTYRLHFIVNRNAGIEEVVENLNTLGYLNVIQNQNNIVISKKSRNSRD